MGVMRLFSSCSDKSHGEQFPKGVKCHRQHKHVIEKCKLVGNPNPSNFQILNHEEIGRFVVVLVKYPECLNYEGDKILVFENVSFGVIQKLKSIDPHFCDSGNHSSPIARFVPTLKGWHYAIQFCKNV